MVKIKIEIEASPQEVREFFGLPDIRPLQEKLLSEIHENMRNGVAGFDALNLMKPLFPAQMQSLETLQKAFWDAFSETDQEDKPATTSKTGNPKKS